ncbi:MAG: 2-oxoacid:acceptor oxidoreductase family protein [Candidatus Omnitrophica bacterium]|nr:2-oxoacid:acceptor oxidoreductase family protein [Candidatus Omnitrophota bacterium]MBU1906270.1 2-oxoacid:acceptor oxidoreductase family protein [Candidatus Omnitrophota bacterium]
MKEIRIHARAGQGAITTAALIGFSYFKEGKYPYAFPHFGAARMGAPMNAFLRVDSKPVRLRSQVYEPNFVIVVDPTLMRGYNCFSGLKDDGIAVVNGKDDLEMPKLKAGQKVLVVPANEIALKTIGKPLANTTLIGAFAAASGELKLDTILEVVKLRFSGKVQEGNIEAVKQGFEFVKNLK